MRKLYVLRPNEEDGRVLDALALRGIDPEDGQIAHPVCPKCGAQTMLAFLDGENFEVITWYWTTEDEQLSDADEWYLVCSHLDCDFEEEVERVDDPVDAVLFDMMAAYCSFDEYCALTSLPPDSLKELSAYLEALLQEQPNRKLQSFLSEAQWRYDEMMADVRGQLEEASSGCTIRFDLNETSISATYVASTEDGVMVLTKPEGQLVVISPELVRVVCSIHEEERDPAELRAALVKADNWIMNGGFKEMVVIQGYHLRLGQVDQVGQYHVRCWEEATALALGLRQVSAKYWEGRFRRSDIAARYDATDAVKVRGHWLKVSGLRHTDSAPHVSTKDAEIAAELGLEPVRSWQEMDRPKEERTIVNWSGVIPHDQVEGTKELRSYYWPIPELTAESGEER